MIETLELRNDSDEVGISYIASDPASNAVEPVTLNTTGTPAFRKLPSLEGVFQCGDNVTIKSLAIRFPFGLKYGVAPSLTQRSMFRLGWRSKTNPATVIEAVTLPAIYVDGESCVPAAGLFLQFPSAHPDFAGGGYLIMETLQLYVSQMPATDPLIVQLFTQSTTWPVPCVAIIEHTLPLGT